MNLISHKEGKLVEKLLFTVVTALVDYIKYLRGKRRAVKAKVMLVSLNPINFFQGETSMAFMLQDDQKVAASVAYVDAVGNPAAVDGAPVWASADETLVTVVAAPDGLSAVISAVGPLTAPGAEVQVTVTADADLGAGVVPLAAVIGIQVVAGQAVVGNIALGAPEPK